jgi:hypothetical protein
MNEIERSKQLKDLVHRWHENETNWEFLGMGNGLMRVELMELKSGKCLIIINGTKLSGKDLEHAKIRVREELVKIAEDLNSLLERI